MDQRLKLAILIAIVTIATVLAHAVYYALGESHELDWPMWLVFTALAVVCVIFGWVASDWKQVLLFIPFPTVILVIFIMTERYFSPETPQRDEDHLEDVTIGVFGTFLISALLFAFGHLLSLSLRWFSRRRKPQ